MLLCLWSGLKLKYFLSENRLSWKTTRTYYNGKKTEVVWSCLEADEQSLPRQAVQWELGTARQKNLKH